MKIIKTFENYSGILTGNDKALLELFVKSLPNNFPDILNKRVEKSKQGIDGVFYMLMGEYIDVYGKDEDKLSSLIVNNDEIFDLIEDRFDINIEW